MLSLTKNINNYYKDVSSKIERISREKENKSCTIL